MRTVPALLCGLPLLASAAAPGIARDGAALPAVALQPTTVRDLLWAWGNPEMTKPGEHTAATYADASPAQRAHLLGVPNVILAGQGLPNDDALALDLTRQVATAPRIVWEIGPDGEGEPRPFVYDHRLEQVRRIAAGHPALQGVLLDDMSTLGIDRGFRPEHIRRIRQGLAGPYAAVQVWGVVYTMSFDRPGLEDYVRELDVISLWTWHAKDTARLAENVCLCTRRFPGKPIVLGLYMHDYGDGRRMPPELHEAQCNTALKLLLDGTVSGLVFLTITNDEAAVAWTARWIAQVGTLPLASGEGGP